MQTASKKVVNGWAMYDWANSVYNLVITSTVFPAYFEAITGDGNENTKQDTIIFLGREFVNTSLYNYTLALSFLIIAFILPLLSSIADFKGTKKRFLRFFMTMGSIACSTMFFFDKSNLWLGILCMIFACIGSWAGLVFYNSYLPEIAAPEDRDRISAKGFAYGYVGSVLLQLVSFVLILKNDLWGISSGFASQLSFLLVGIWWFAFGHYAINRMPKPVAAGEANQYGDLRNGYKELRKVAFQLLQLPVLKRFLLSFFFVSMGVQTVMLAATLYGKSELQIETQSLIIAILIIQLIAIPGAFAIAALSKRTSNLFALTICIAVWIGICIGAFYLPPKNIIAFYTLATVVGFVMGGIQSLCRSTYAKLMPETKDTASFFSFYDVTEKVAIVIGMFSFGIITELTGTQRNAVLALMVFFILSLIFLLFTRWALKNKK
ncbi:MAG TPA: MFS transporter [Chitinophagaceae bacterium]|jgi:UMF1 family MFS transporter|nr:MFS transporter [Chitinophagaceae bacterium]